MFVSFNFSMFRIRPFGVFLSDSLMGNHGSYRKLVGLLRRGISSVTRPLPKHMTTQIEKKLGETSMSRARFEPMIPMFERAMTFHASDRAVTLIGLTLFRLCYLFTN
jgi:hypothetical protein